ncbi:uncharacterized protein BCR38DRAFT_331135 [Pseudomassariella vexata]|uniref:Heme oxygenase-like protein n=1 Tax=Pseudomassariella vexata TaxID=1141098 RepID=A0A1Y2EK18_9PEZI|nr:uncharacterized protein BCR38DRAFT_331135 [Pseudomassariella vexata]ORY71857.1 hypothetical protein BCR38DRAFT_331135 [Pseudomassariella vexata]
MSSKTADQVRPLSDSINAATRSVHTKLNKLVIYRLPLAIPLRTDDPTKYVSGLLHITPIYSTFESLWQDILDQPLPACNIISVDEHSCQVCKPSATIHHTHNVLDAPHQPTVCTRIHSLLAHLHTPGLTRTQALKEDIFSITGWPSSVIEEQLNLASEKTILSHFVTHIRREVQARPHVLLAYAWVLYMALFSGGRFIRATLSRIDASFWYSISLSPPASIMGRSSSSDSSEDDDSNLPLKFFTFDTPHDGDDLKQSFKKHLAESSARLLTPQERRDIVEEAHRIFEFMIEAVGELDAVCGTDREDIAEQPAGGLIGRVGRLLGLRTRDSVVVAKERRDWRRLVNSHDEGSGSDGENGSDSGNSDEIVPLPLPRRSADEGSDELEDKFAREHVHFERLTRPRESNHVPSMSRRA